MANKDDLFWAQQHRNEMFLFSGEPDFTAYDLNDLFKLLVVADDAYHNSATPIFEDAEYDALRLFCETADASNTYFLGVGSNVRGGKVDLPYKMGSLTQAYVGGDITAWVVKHNLQDEDMSITEKLDGQSSLLVYGQTGDLQISYSRGDGYKGADTFRHTSKITNLVKNVGEPMVIRAELQISKDNWINHIEGKFKRSGGEFYKNARNTISGVINSSEATDPAIYQYIDAIAYEILEPAGLSKAEQLDKLSALGFKTPAWFSTKGSKLVDEYCTKVLNILRDKSAYEIDGIVIDIIDPAIRARTNPSKDSLNPEFARKFKVADDKNMAIAEVIEVQWNISKNGYCKPRVKIKPVELVGVTVQHATGFNAKFIQDNMIGPGARIRITRSGDVIPFIIGVVEGTKPQLPDYEVKWNETGVDLVLVNIDDNETVKLEQLIDFAAKIGVDHIGEGNMKTLFEHGYTTPLDFVKMLVSDLAIALNSMPTAKKIMASKEEKTHNVPWYIIAGAHPAFGRGVGVRKMKKLYEAFAGDMTKLANVADIVAVEGFEQKTAEKISSGYAEFEEFVQDCSSSLSFSKYEAPKGGALSGQSFLFTGFRSPELEAQIVGLGGKISSSVSGKLTYLVAADPNENSGKLTKARDIGTKIISREDLNDLLGG